MGGWNNAETLTKLQRQLTVVALYALIFYIAMQVGAFFADLLRILAISLLLSYCFITAVDFLDRFLRQRALAVALVYATIVTVAVVAGLFVIPAIVYQVTGLVGATLEKLPELLQMANNALVPLQQKLHERMIDIKVIDILTTFAAQLPKPDPAAVVSRVSDMAVGTMTWTIYAVSVSVVTFYFLLDGHRIKEAVIGLFPVNLHAVLRIAASDMDRSLQSFIKGQVVLGILFGAVMLIVYAVLNVQYALLLSAFLAICEVLPVIGPLIGFFPALIAVAFYGTILPGDRVVHMILLTAIFMVLQQVKDSIVGPRYMGSVIGLHPVMIFIAIMVGARLDGMLGIILALPAACVLTVLLSHFPLHGSASKVALANAEHIDQPLP